MPSPLEKIKEGLQKGNWQLVSDGYFDLTNERFLPVEKKKSKKVEIKKEVEAFNHSLAIPSPPQEISRKEETQTERVHIGKRPNMFFDDGTEHVRDKLTPEERQRAEIKKKHALQRGRGS